MGHMLGVYEALGICMHSFGVEVPKRSDLPSIYTLVLLISPGIMVMML